MVMVQDNEKLKTKFDQIEQLPEDGLKSSPETSCYMKKLMN